ncbi:MAG: helix-turn-helix domain-containing protein [Solirubrobacteraceae bacterium]
MSDRVEVAGGARWAKRLPGAALSEWVAVIWCSADDRGGRTRERLLPRGTVELVIELGPGHTSIIGPDRRIDVDPVSVVGVSPGSVVLDRANRFETIGVTFRPGGAIALLGVCAGELDGAPLPLGLLWGSAAAELRERASAATGPDEKLAAIERVLARELRHVEQARRYDPAIAAMRRIAAAPERCSIADVSASVGVSRRRLEETFRVAVGLTPKRFQRLWRFRRALERIDDRHDLGWAAFALERGYYDQAHFSNEFRHHTGLTPEGYLAARTPALNHARIDTAT